MQPCAVKDIAFVAVYASDFEKSYNFYHSVLGLQDCFSMGANSCFFKIGQQGGLYLQGGNKPALQSSAATRSAFVLKVESAFDLHTNLIKHGVSVIQAKPEQMSASEYWFTFSDPDGNLLEVLGGR